jgi:hypothetical protein
MTWGVCGVVIVVREGSSGGGTLGLVRFFGSGRVFS